MYIYICIFGSICVLVACVACHNSCSGFVARLLRLALTFFAWRSSSLVCGCTRFVRSFTHRPRLLRMSYKLQDLCHCTGCAKCVPPCQSRIQTGVRFADYCRACHWNHLCSRCGFNAIASSSALHDATEAPKNKKRKC